MTNIETLQALVEVLREKLANATLQNAELETLWRLDRKKLELLEANVERPEEPAADV